MKLSEFDQINELCDQLQQKYPEHKGQSLRILLNDSDEGRDFCEFDLSQLKAKDLSYHIEEQAEEYHDVEEGNFVCPCVLTDGS
eukprot:7917356-Karenia_brevis.AAC.1